MSEFADEPSFFTPGQSRPDCPLFVFLPGMDESEGLMGLQTAGLETAFDVHCFLVPNDDLTTWDNLAEKVVALTQAELEKAPRQSVYLCGESFGSCIALKAALRVPQLFSRIVLINFASSFHRVPWLNLGSLLFHWLPDLFYQDLFYQLSPFTALPFLAHLDRLSPAGFQALRKGVSSAPKETADQRLSLLREFAIDEQQLAQLTQPVLLIASQDDRLLPSVSEAQHLAKIFPHAQVVTLPHSGHACLLETDINLLEIMQAKKF